MSMWGPPLAGDYHQPDPEGPGLAGDYDQPADDGSDDDKPYRSIWDDDQDDNPAEGYKYEKPGGVPTRPPTGFWGAGGGGNPNWDTPTPGQRWGDDSAGGLDPRTGLPESSRGSVRYVGKLDGVKRRYRKEARSIMEKYDKVRHPSRHVKKKIMAELSAKMPHSEVKKVMKDRNWL